MEPRTLGCKHRNCQNQLKKSLLNATAAAILTSVWPGVSGRCVCRHVSETDCPTQGPGPRRSRRQRRRRTSVET
eukprot:4056424-Prymnesium_polylepis.1